MSPNFFICIGTKAAFAWGPSCTPSFQHTRQWFLCRSHSSVMPRDRPVGSLAAYFTCSLREFILPLRARLIIIVFSPHTEVVDNKKGGGRQKVPVDNWGLTLFGFVQDQLLLRHWQYLTYIASPILSFHAIG